MPRDPKYAKEQPITINGFSGGFNVADEPDEVDDNQMIDGSYNFLVEKSKSIERRPGTKLYSKTIAWFIDAVEDSYNAP